MREERSGLASVQVLKNWTTAPDGGLDDPTLVTGDGSGGIAL